MNKISTVVLGLILVSAGVVFAQQTQAPESTLSYIDPTSRCR